MHTGSMVLKVILGFSETYGYLNHFLKWCIGINHLDFALKDLAQCPKCFLFGHRGWICYDSRFPNLCWLNLSIYALSSVCIPIQRTIFLCKTMLIFRSSAPIMIFAVEISDLVRIFFTMMLFHSWLPCLLDVASPALPIFRNLENFWKIKVWKEKALEPM